MKWIRVLNKSPDVLYMYLATSGTSLHISLYFLADSGSGQCSSTPHTETFEKDMVEGCK